MVWRRRIAILVVLLGFGLAVAYGLMPRPVAVDVAAVQRGPFRVTVEEEGKTRVTERFVISAPVAGFARRIDLEAGDAVERGQPLAVLEPLRPQVLDPRARAEAEARVEAARSALEAARAEAEAAQAAAELARAEYRRVLALCERECASEEERDRARAQALTSDARLRSAELAVDVARHELEAARTALRYSPADETEPAQAKELTIRAPVHGRVLAVLHESEGVVGSGEPLLEIADPAALEVEVELLTMDAVRVAPGTAVELHRWGGEQTLEGRVRVVEPGAFTKVSALGVEEQRVRVIADILSPPEHRSSLGDRYRVEARFVLWRGEDVLQIPASALFRRDEDWAVFRLEADRARVRVVEVGRRNGLRAQILSGLAVGDRMVIHPGDELEDGRRVRVRFQEQ